MKEIKELRKQIEYYNKKYHEEDISEISDYAYVMETGRITMAGPGKELLSDDRVKKAYLGE